MSHFTVLVAAKDQRQLKKLLDPYDENKEVEPYQDDCTCIGQFARREASEAAAKLCGPFDAFRESFKASSDQSQAAWEKHIVPYTQAEQAALDKHPMKDKPAPDCEECHGTGKYMRTYNPQSKWDWWVIGGRWEGLLTLKNGKTANQAPAGKVDWAAMLQKRRDDATKDWYSYHFLMDQLKRKVIDEHTYRMEVFNIVEMEDVKAAEELKLADYVDKHSKQGLTFAFINQDGKWIEEANMGWWAITTNPNESYGEQWWVFVNSLPDDLNVYVLDCHI